MEELLDDWGDWQRAAGLSQRTITERRGVIRSLCTATGAGPLDMTPRLIIRFLGRKGLKPSTRATYHASIRAFYAWAHKAGLLEVDPTAQTPTPKRPKAVPRPVTDRQLMLILAVANRRRTRMMVLLAALAGLRVHEIAKVRGCDVDLDSCALTVAGKGGKTAILPLHEAILDAAHLFPTTGYWFPSYQREGPVLPSAVGKAIKSAMNRAGCDTTPHQLRHGFGTSLLNNGANLRVVQELMRHDSIASTQIYTLVSSPQMRAAIDGLVLPDADAA